MKLLLNSLLTLVFFFCSMMLGAQNAREYFSMGREQLLEENYYGSVEHFHNALRINPDYLEARQGLAEAFFYLDEFGEAQTHISRALRLNKNNVKTRILHGKILIGLSNFSKARAAFDYVLEREPNNLEARFGIAEVLLFTGRNEEAAALITELLRIEPDYKNGLLGMIVILNSKGSGAKAGMYIDRLLRYHMNDPEVHFILAYHYLYNKNLDRALHHITTSLDLKPGYNAALKLSGKIYVMQENYSAALELYSQLLKDDPSDHLLWYSAAYINRKLGNFEDAIRLYKKSLSLRPDDELVRLGAESYLREATPAEDEARLEFAQYHIERGKIHERENLYQKAARAYRNALRVYSYSAEARYRYALIQKRKGLYIGYYHNLLFIKNHSRDAIPGLDDELEIFSPLLDQTLLTDWGYETGARPSLSREKIDLIVFPETQAVHSNEHFNSVSLSAQELAGYLSAYDKINAVYKAPTEAGFATLLSESREAGADYFVVTQVRETQSSFYLKAEFYMAGSGAHIGVFSLSRSGNERVFSVLSTISRDIYATIPLYGRIVQTREDEALISLGLDHGMEEGDELLVAQKNSVARKSSAPGFSVPRDKLLGTLTITRAEDYFSQGTLKSNTVFDSINPEDVVFKIKEDVDPARVVTESFSDDTFKRWILKLR